VGIVLGSALAGALVAPFGPGSAIAIDAGSFVVSAACIWRMSPRPGAVAETSSRFLEQLRKGWHGSSRAAGCARSWRCSPPTT
jgi:hypothetical protein